MPTDARERRYLPSCKPPQVKTHSLNLCETKNLREKAFYLALFIQQVQDPQFCLYKVYAGLVIVEIDESPRDSLLHVLFLFQLKHVLRGEKTDELSTGSPVRRVPVHTRAKYSLGTSQIFPRHIPKP